METRGVAAMCHRRARRKRRIKLQSNEHWGRISGFFHKITGEPIFKLKKWGNGAMNSGPVGWKLKRAQRGRFFPVPKPGVVVN